MGKLRKDETGFSAVEVVLVLVIVGLIGTVGFMVYKNHNKTTKASVATTTTTKSAATTPANTSTPQKEETQKQDTSKADPNEGYLVVKEWGLRFKTPSGLTDVKYAIHGEMTAFFAKPTGSSVQYVSDYDRLDAYVGITEDGHFPYATGLLYRSKDATKDRGGRSTDGKKVGSYYYYTAWSFSGLATGAACLPIYGDSSDSNCDANYKAFQLVNRGDTALLNTIELAQ